MPLISTKLHGVLDYAGGVGSLAAPKLLRDRRAAVLMGASGAGTLVTSALTDYELGLRRTIPMPVHLIADASTGALLIAGAVGLRSRGAKILDWVPLAAVGAVEIAAAALTKRRPGDRPAAAERPPVAVTGITGEGIAARTAAADGPPLAPAPVETPGPSVTPPMNPESDVERAERIDAALPDADAGAPATADVLVAEQEAAAAAEAAAIGGVAPASTEDPAMEPVYQAGGGEQEGWEQAEADLIENASHGDGHGNPERDAFSPELESDRSDAVYGEADRIPSTEVVDDPGTDADDPGAGPGLAAERGPGLQPRDRRPTRE